MKILQIHLGTQSQVEFATNVLIPEKKRVGLQNVSYYLPNGYAIGTRFS